MGIPDNYDAFIAREREQSAWLEKRPMCSECHEHIQTDKLYYINDEFICPECLKNNYERNADDFVS